MIAEFILSAFMGLIAGAILSWFFFRMRKKRMEKPQRIIDNLEKQEKEGKVFFVDGKQYNFRKDLEPKKFEQHLEELRKEQEREPYRPISNLPPLPPPPAPIENEVKRIIQEPKEQKSDTEKKKPSNSLNKMLGRR